MRFPAFKYPESFLYVLNPYHASIEKFYLLLLAYQNRQNIFEDISHWTATECNGGILSVDNWTGQIKFSCLHVKAAYLPYGRKTSRAIIKAQNSLLSD